MPETAQGVFIERLAALDTPGSAFREFASTEAWEGMFSEEEVRDLGPVAYTAALKAGLSIRVTGGSEFQPPQGMGGGDARLCLILVTKQGLSALRDQLDRGDGINGLKRDGELYSARSVLMSPELPQRELFVTFAGDHVLIIAPSAAEARSMRQSIVSPAPKPQVPARWARAAAEINLDSPLLALRVYDKARDDDWSFPGATRLGDNKAQVTAFAAALESPRQPALTCFAVSPEPQKAAAAYAVIGPPFSGHVFTADTFRAKYSRRGQGGAGEVYLVIMVLFGHNIAI